MSIAYELSLWRDYPGSNSLSEEKECILSSDTMSFLGKAANIELKREYTGKTDLSFEMPVKIVDEETGKLVHNELVDRVREKAKIKLWRDELWYNYITQQWTHGRWYEFEVSKKKEGRSKRKLNYVFECVSAYIAELSHTGYNLVFDPETDIVAENGMGTAHTLAERVLANTDWQYVKTETFPDYKEDFNLETGEIIKTPISTDQIEFIHSENRYGYCYTVEVSNPTDQTTISNILDKAGIRPDSGLYGFDEDNDKFWYQRTATDEKRPYLLGYTKTLIDTKYATPLLAQDYGGMGTGFLTYADSNLWNRFVGDTTTLTAEQVGNAGEDTLKYYLEFAPILNSNFFYNAAAASKSLEAGEIYCIKLAYKQDNKRQVRKFRIYDWDSKGKINLEDSPVIEFDVNFPKLTGNIENDKYEGSMWFQLPTRVAHPYFVFETDAIVVDGNEFSPTRLGLSYIYRLIGATTDNDNIIRQRVSENNRYYGTLSDLLGDFDNIDTNGTEDGHIWCPPNQIAQDYNENGTDVYLCEFYIDGEYKPVYIGLPKTTEIVKINSYETDKRRAIKVEKSNCFNILETIAKTFYCFTRFMVDHDANGYITKDADGRLNKKITFVSNLGNNQFNGFNYGVNLKQVERTSDAENLVTKMYVETIDNQYESTNSGVISIINSRYNTFGEQFIYNFSYYLMNGLIDPTIFSNDYQFMVNHVRDCNANIKSYNENYNYWLNYKDTQESYVTTYELIAKSLKSQAEEKMNLIKWEAIKRLEMNSEAKENAAFDFSTIDISKWEHFKAEITDWESDSYSVQISGFGNLKTLGIYLSTRLYDDSNRLIYGGGNSDIEFALQTIMSCQDLYNNYQIKLHDAQTQLEVATEKVEDYNNKINTYITLKQQYINNFEKLYRRFIIEGSWSPKDYIDADTCYLDATRTMTTSCYPKVTYSIDALDLSKIANPYDYEDKSWGVDFTYDIGDTTYIKDEELFGLTEQKSMIASITAHIDSNKPDEIKIQNYETRFEDLFQSIAAAVTTLTLNENIYSRAGNFKANGTISDNILQNSLDENKNLVLSVANNQVDISNEGLIIRDSEGTGNVLRAISAGIFFSNDNGATYTSGITPKGINASLIAAGEIDTSKIVIRSGKTPQYTLNNLGLTAYLLDNGREDYTNSFVRFDQYGLYMTDEGQYFGEGWNEKLYMDEYIEEQITVDINNLSYAKQIKDVGYWYDDEPSYGEDALYIYIDDNKVLKNDIWSIDAKVVNTELASITKYTHKYRIEDIQDKKVLVLLFEDPREFSAYSDPNDWRFDLLIITVRYKKTIPMKQNERIANHSIISLTKQGFILNSQKENGAMELSTTTNSFIVKDSLLKNRIKLGHIRDEILYDRESLEYYHEAVYGLDIYDGALRVYGDSYYPGIEDTTPSLAFKGERMYLYNPDILGNLTLRSYSDEGATLNLTNGQISIIDLQDAYVNINVGGISGSMGNYGEDFTIRADVFSFSTKHDYPTTLTNEGVYYYAGDIGYQFIRWGDFHTFV